MFSALIFNHLFTIRSPFQCSPKPCLTEPHSATPSSTTQLEISGAQSQADLAYPPTSINNAHHCTPPSYRSASDTESAPIAEYQEWPFQGFLKRATIGNQITYNLGFSLSHIPEHLSLSLHSEVSSTSSRESSVEATVSRRAATSRKPGKEVTKNQESLLAKLVYDDKGRDRTALPKLYAAVTEGELLHEARGKASEAGSEAWCKGRWRVNKDSSLLDVCGCVDAKMFVATEWDRIGKTIFME
ncbi:hypothetical protein BJ875DRAFT_488285 [Amylocarpus encephaloides]|uniref:Uncharacterized protein n=1 Tax=Amylocarpus encephaloides TaxID=45428 RepID=A0A9P7YAJ6_9HELO|nr:hypothetical protein BJ875DRAFT_488285 [Amylocarpus encephaloides]